MFNLLPVRHGFARHLCSSIIKRLIYRVLGRGPTATLPLRDRPTMDCPCRRAARDADGRGQMQYTPALICPHSGAASLGGWRITRKVFR
ncbi:hypothetical protein KQQSB11_300333 [Klebsiella quasipneumoniae subsp. quasipneumoniae]|nr:hypothetical protein KQQSB11_300333 [Klebsiella quasipneumoniae subsp. quasipneumoniae]